MESEQFRQELVSYKQRHAVYVEEQLRECVASAHLNLVDDCMKSIHNQIRLWISHKASSIRIHLNVYDVGNHPLKSKSVRKHCRLYTMGEINEAFRSYQEWLGENFRIDYNQVDCMVYRKALYAEQCPYRKTFIVQII